MRAKATHTKVLTRSRPCLSKVLQRVCARARSTYHGACTMVESTPATENAALSTIELSGRKPGRGESLRRAQKKPLAVSSRMASDPVPGTNQAAPDRPIPTSCLLVWAWLCFSFVA